jgi:hypothetical protein
MRHRLAYLLGSAALAAMMWLSADAQEYSNGGKGAAGRGPATLAPVEAYGVHPPGPDPADAQHGCSRASQQYVPYYAPLSPVASTARWKPWAYHPLLPYCTPYYPGYSPHRFFNPRPAPYGSNGWGAGPGPNFPLPEEPGTTPLNYSDYTSVVTDETMYWNMGGNGLVPYGSPRPDGAQSADLIDAIQASRACGVGHAHWAAPRGPAIVSPMEVEGKPQPGDDRPGSQRATPSELIPPGQVQPGDAGRLK